MDATFRRGFTISGTSLVASLILSGCKQEVASSPNTVNEQGLDSTKTAHFGFDDEEGGSMGYR